MTFEVVDAHLRSLDTRENQSFSSMIDKFRDSKIELDDNGKKG